MWKLIFIIVLFTISKIDSAKILGLFPGPIKSHQVLSSVLMEELARRGHEVTMIASFPSENPPKNYKEIVLNSLHEKRNKMWEDLVRNDISYWARFKSSFEFIKTFSVYFLQDPHIQDFLKSGEEFDLVIQLMGFNEATLGISHVVNASSVINFNINSAIPFTQWIHMTPAPYSYVPHLFLGYTDDMNFKERFINTVTMFISDSLFPLVWYQYQKQIYNEIFPGAPSLDTMIEKIDLHLFNTHISTESPRPYLPNVIPIGGFIFNTKQNLSGDVQEFLDKSKRGVIYFSFGSNYNSSLMLQDQLEAFIEAFKVTPYDIIWKVDADLPIKLPNVLTKKWLLQAAILAHPNVKIFITHSGLGGTVEAIYNSVPMITIPLSGDQFKNSADIVKAGFGVPLKLEGITKEDIVGAINELTNNKIYKEKIELRSDIYRNQEMDPMDKAMFWIEHVIKHKGAKHLKAKASQIYWFQYMLLDVLGTIVVVLGVVLFVTWKILKKIYCFCFCKKKNDEIKKKQ